MPLSCTVAFDVVEMEILRWKVGPEACETHSKALSKLFEGWAWNQTPGDVPKRV